MIVLYLYDVIDFYDFFSSHITVHDIKNAEETQEVEGVCEH